MPPPVLPTYKSRSLRRTRKSTVGSILESPWVVFGLLFGLIVFFVASVYLGVSYVGGLSKGHIEGAPRVLNDIETWAKGLDSAMAGSLDTVAKAAVGSVESKLDLMRDGEAARKAIEMRGEGENLMYQEKRSGPAEEW